MFANPHSPQPLLNYPRAASCLIGGICLIGLILTAGTWLNSSRAAFQQSREERVIVKRSDFSPPVKISLAKTKKGPIRFSEKFLDDPDWFKGLTVNVTNTSDTAVIFVGVEVTFLRPEDQEKEPPLLWHLEYGDNPFRYKTQDSIPPLRVKPISRDDVVELSLNDTSFDDIKMFLKNVKYSGSNALELRITTIGFIDGTAWYVGEAFRRDPTSFWAWSPLNSKPKSEVNQPKGGA